MLCIIHQDHMNNILGWILATDLHDARRQASVVQDLAECLYRMPEFPEPRGIQLLTVPSYDNTRYTMLAS